jgi:PKD repeat protein
VIPDKNKYSLISGIHTRLGSTNLLFFSRYYFLLFTFQFLFVAAIFGSNPQIHSVVPSATSVPKYEMLELIVELTATYSSPYAFDQVNLQGIFTSPGGQQYVVDGFFMQDFSMPEPNVLEPDGPPGWRIRFSPNQTGGWSYAVKITDTQGNHTFSTQQFVCTGSNRKGFIKRNGNHLVYDNGDRFLAIGTNLAWAWWSSGFVVYDDWLTSLKDNGANFVKLTLAPWSFEFEWGNGNMGNYTNRQSRAWALDWVFEYLAQYRIYTQMHFLIHDEVTPGVYMGWELNPYNIVNGGPCNSPQEFLTNETARHYYKQRIRYINARWGYSPYVQSWEIMSEADNTPIYNSHYQQNLNWLLEMTQYTKSVDIYNRPVSSGFAWAQKDPNYWNSDLVDYTQSHVYAFIPDLEMKIYNYSRWYQEKYGKPTIVGEFALGHSPEPIYEQDPAGITFHNVLWATVMSGTIGSAMSWWWDNYLYPNGLFSHFQPISSFVNQVNIKDVNWEHEIPISTSAVHGTLEVFPDFSSTSQKAPSNTFYIGPSGSIMPTIMDLSRHLFGSLYNSQRNPPTFHVNYLKAGQFKVRTGSPVLFSKIRIKLNGNTIINTNASSNSTYTIDVPAGMHTISVDNSGTGIMRVDKYIFDNYMPELRTFTLRKNNHVAGWFQNINYNWKQLLESGPPSPVENGKIYLKDLNPGLYRVRWFNGNSNIDSTQFLFTTDGKLTVNAPPVLWSGAFEAKFHAPFNIDFAATPQSGLAPLTVQFTDQTEYIGGSGFSWLWTFGDGTFSFQQNPTKTFNQPGIYTVKLQVSSGAYTHSLTKNNFIVAEQPVVANFVGAPTIVVSGNPVTFTNLSLGNPTSFLWNFGDNTFSFQQNPNKTYNQAGNYSVSLQVQKGAQSNTMTKNNYIQVLTPLIADFNANPTIAVAGQQIAFIDLSQGNPETWDWDFGNGATGNLQNPVITFADPGSYTITLNVATNYQQNSISKPDLITIFAPLEADFTADTTFAWTGDTISFTDLSTGSPENWFWEFGDGNSSTLQHPQHVYNQEGYYSVSMTVTDQIQNVTITKADYLYIREPLVADFSADTTLIVQGQSVQFTDLSSGFPESWYWVFNDGNISTQQNPLHTFGIAGEYDILLRIKRGVDRSVVTKSGYITVLPALEANFEADKQFAVVNELVQFTDLSNGNPEIWHWDLGNFSTAVVQNPVTSYSEPGFYSIRFDVYNTYQHDSLTKANYIHIVDPLVADFTVDPQTIQIGTMVTFIDLSTGNPESWEWRIGDSMVIFDQSPEITFWEPGFVDVALIVSNEYFTDTLLRESFIYVQPPSQLQNILLHEGWNGISTYIKPLFPAIETIFSDVCDKIIFAFNEQGIYSPPLNLNTIGIWDTSKGLIVKMTSADSVTIAGYETVGNQLELNEGWNFLPVLSECEQPTETLHDNMGDMLKMIKPVAGTSVLWPDFEIHTLNALKPGKAYFILVSQDTIFSFPACNP